MTASVPDQEKTPDPQNADCEAAPVDRGRVDEDKEPITREVVEREHVQRGIQKAVAITAAWNKKSLILAYAGYERDLSVTTGD